MTTHEVTCRNCKHSERYDHPRNAEPETLCLLEPPRVVVCGTKTASIYPRVMEKYRCGHFEAKETL